ncbi:MAG: hypothetical protein HY898_29385 [Deltaproteobacteria bacterium]|nr:hypothetical protein [Deltaproteobacteria bacterium]
MRRFISDHREVHSRQRSDERDPAARLLPQELLADAVRTIGNPQSDILERMALVDQLPKVFGDLLLVLADLPHERGFTTVRFFIESPRHCLLPPHAERASDAKYGTSSGMAHETSGNGV